MKAMKATPKKDAKKTTKKNEPSFSVEHSRNQVLCRTGGSRKGSTKAIKYAAAGGKEKAIAQAKVWLRKAMAA